MVIPLLLILWLDTGSTAVERLPSVGSVVDETTSIVPSSSGHGTMCAPTGRQTQVRQREMPVTRKKNAPIARPRPAQPPDVT